MQLDCPRSLLYVPSRQGKQLDAPSCENSPVSHGKHPIDPKYGWYDPARQSRQAVQPSREAYLPGKHGEHSLAPCNDVAWPTAQSVQLVPIVMLENEPGTHCSQPVGKQ